VLTAACLLILVLSWRTYFRCTLEIRDGNPIRSDLNSRSVSRTELSQRCAQDSRERTPSIARGEAARSAAFQEGRLKFHSPRAPRRDAGRSVAFHASGFDYLTLPAIAPGQTARTAKGASTRREAKGNCESRTRAPLALDFGGHGALRSPNNPIIYTFSLNGADRYGAIVSRPRDSTVGSY